MRPPDSDASHAAERDVGTAHFSLANRRSANPVALYRRRVEFDAESRPLGQQDMSLLELQRGPEKLGAQRVGAHVVFEHLRMRRVVDMRRGGLGGDEVAGRRQSHRSTPGMRRQPEVRRCSERCDPPGLGEAADAGNRRLDDIDAAPVDQRTKIANRMMSFAGRDRNRRAGTQLGIAPDIPWRQRFPISVRKSRRV